MFLSLLNKRRKYKTYFRFMQCFCYKLSRKIGKFAKFLSGSASIKTLSIISMLTAVRQCMCKKGGAPLGLEYPAMFYLVILIFS